MPRPFALLRCGSIYTSSENRKEKTGKKTRKLVNRMLSSSRWIRHKLKRFSLPNHLEDTSLDYGTLHHKLQDFSKFLVSSLSP
jgi:hypothetical protein